MNRTSADHLVNICHQALPVKYDPITTAVLKRLTYELDIIIDRGYADYFLIVWDIVQWANRRGIPTVGRGSAAGSLVSYLLSITPVDKPDNYRPVHLDFGFIYALNESFRFGIHFQRPFVAFYWKF